MLRFLKNKLFYLVLFLFILGLFIFNKNTHFHGHSINQIKNRIMASLQESTSPTLSKKKVRELELGQISNKSKNTQNEQKVILNDPALQQAWGVEKSQALKAWEITQGSNDIIVAIIDTGCDLAHEDLDGNFWSNQGEMGLDKNGQPKQSNKIDDDQNGFIDDVHGWNFASKNNDLTDNHGHGTHIAGIIGARANNGHGIVGISPNVKMMCLKYYDPKLNSDHLGNTIASFHYAIKMGAKIINYSGGGTEPSFEEKAALELAQEKGILLVAAAGNERSNSDVHHYYPADYGLSNIISVTAINPNTEVLPSSNYGVETVDLAAPGQNILSTLPGSTYGYMTGTSQATAFVTGAAVLVYAHHPEFLHSDVKKYILATGDSQKTLLAKTKTSKQLNLFKSLVMMDSTISLTGLKGSSSQIIPSSTGSFENGGNGGGSGEGSRRAPGASGNSLLDLNQFSRDMVKKTTPPRKGASEE